MTDTTLDEKAHKLAEQVPRLRMALDLCIASRNRMTHVKRDADFWLREADWVMREKATREEGKA